MDVNWTEWGALLAVIAIVLVAWTALKLAARVALSLIALAVVVFALFELGFLAPADAETAVSSLSSFVVGG